jgi:hypothetical protein
MSNTETLKALYVHSVMRYGITWGRVGIRLRVKSGLLYKRKPAELCLVQTLEIHTQKWGTHRHPPKKKVELRLVQNLEIQTQIFLTYKGFHLFHVNRNTHFH